MNTIQDIQDIQEFNTDVYLNQNLVADNGFNKHYTFEQMLELAVTNDCNLIVKAGRWYLKKGVPNATYNFLSYNQQKGFYPNAKSYLITYKSD